MCVYGHMSKKSNYLKKKKNNNLLLSAKPEIVVSDSGIFEISGKPSFVEAVLWREYRIEYAVFLPSLFSISTKS